MHFIIGVIGLIWVVLWILVVYESPLTHPFISEEEILYIGIDQNSEDIRKVSPKFIY